MNTLAWSSDRGMTPSAEFHAVTVASYSAIGVGRNTLATMWDADTRCIRGAGTLIRGAWVSVRCGGTGGRGGGANILCDWTRGRVKWAGVRADGLFVRAARVLAGPVSALEWIVSALGSFACARARGVPAMDSFAFAVERFVFELD
ncbi:MAG: hypothetical protein K2W85_00540 [Phycisphaerales bacterium]|nr:hypothetical protein [Phycisphaerales bacterium]